VLNDPEGVVYSDNGASRILEKSLLGDIRAQADAD